ncbi:ETS domain-containing protein Elk-4-like isoform X1 [Montipora capricornis]|uniref:ETS domain-containing protein Elk-4-like isoform X1 n=2 Tax=Montipora capricornis TaxID=246305 RepID=UPI0035F1374F
MYRIEPGKGTLRIKGIRVGVCDTLAYNLNKSTSLSSIKLGTSATMTEFTQRKSDPGERRKESGRINNTLHLWEFLLELLEDERYASLISWTRKEAGEFKIKQQEDVAHKWGRLKQRASMNYDKLSRSLRYYYHKGIIKKVQGQRLVYKFEKLPYAYKPVKYNWPWKLPSEEEQDKPVKREKSSFSREVRQARVSAWTASQSEQLSRQVKQEFATPEVSNTSHWAVTPSDRATASEQDVKNEIPKTVPRLVPLITPTPVSAISAINSRNQSPDPIFSESSPRCPHSEFRNADYRFQRPSQAMCRSKIIFPPCSCHRSANVITEVKSVPVRVITRIV